MRHAIPRSLPVSVKALSLCLLVALVLVVGVQAQTQITSGTIQGTVLDANGAAVPGASVEVRNVETNFVRALSTDEDGRFVALQLPSGRYTITVAKPCFATVMVYLPDGNCNATKRPSSKQLRARTKFVSTFLTSTLAPGTAAPFASRTVP